MYMYMHLVPRMNLHNIIRKTYHWIEARTWLLGSSAFLSTSPLFLFYPPCRARLGAGSLLQLLHALYHRDVRPSTLWQWPAITQDGRMHNVFVSNGREDIPCNYVHRLLQKWYTNGGGFNNKYGQAPSSDSWLASNKYRGSIQFPLPRVSTFVVSLSMIYIEGQHHLCHIMLNIKHTSSLQMASCLDVNSCTLTEQSCTAFKKYLPCRQFLVTRLVAGMIECYLPKYTSISIRKAIIDDLLGVKCCHHLLSSSLSFHRG